MVCTETDTRHTDRQDVKNSRRNDGPAPAGWPNENSESQDDCESVRRLTARKSPTQRCSSKYSRAFLRLYCLFAVTTNGHYNDCARIWCIRYTSALNGLSCARLMTKRTLARKLACVLFPSRSSSLVNAVESRDAAKAQNKKNYEYTRIAKRFSETGRPRTLRTHRRAEW